MNSIRHVLLGAGAAICTATVASAAFVTSPPAVNGPNTVGSAQVADPPADRTASCDAACLQGLARNYLAALARRDYSTLAVAPNLLVVENGQATRIGDSLWKVLEKHDANATLFADPVQGQVIALTTVEESAHQPFILMVRLKIEERRIAEVVTMLTSAIDAGQHFRPDNIASFDPQALALVPAEQRMTRAELSPRGIRRHASGDLEVQCRRASQCRFTHLCVPRDPPAGD